MTPMDSHVRVRGTPVKNLVRFVEKELPPALVADVLSKLRPEDAQRFRGMILANEEYPLETVNRFTELAALAKSEDLFSFAHRAGRFSANLSLNGAYNMILMVTTVDYALRNAHVLWARVYTGGALTTEKRTNGATIRATAFPSHTASCGRITGFFEVIAESVQKNVRTSHSSCVAKGDPVCEWSFIWR